MNKKWRAGGKEMLQNWSTYLSQEKVGKKSRDKAKEETWLEWEIVSRKYW